MSNILVTGSEGFIGRNLIRKLCEDPENSIMGFDTKGNEPEDLFGHSRTFDYVDQIYHLGAISSTTEQDVNKINRYNTQFSVRLFEKAIEYGIPVVYASSGSVYGNTMKDGQYIYSPLNYYAASKMMIDMWVRDHIKDFKHVVGLRFFNVYGEDEQKDDLSISPIYRFTQQAKNDGVIKIFKGSQHTYRDFVCVEDVVESMLWATNKANPGIYDVGTGAPKSFMDIAEMVSTKYDVPIKFIDMPEILKGKYQTYTKAKQPPGLCNTRVEKWLEDH